MNNLHRLSELAQIQARLAPQIESAQALCRNVSPQTLSLLQKMSASPTYKTMISLSSHQSENTALSAKCEKEAITLMDAFLSALEKMTPEEQESVIYGASSVEVPKEIFEHAIGDSPQSEKHSLHVDILCTVSVLPKDIDGSWMQIRKAMYPVVHDRLAATIALCGILLNVYGSCAPMLKHLLIVLAVVSWVVDAAGDPNSPSSKDQ